jgi:hypothetical protein
LPTSFSAFSLETVVLIERREYGPAAGYVARSAHNGAVISTSRCYQAGKDTRCDTQSFNGTPTTPFIPNGGRPR